MGQVLDVRALESLDRGRAIALWQKETVAGAKSAAVRERIEFELLSNGVVVSVLDAIYSAISCAGEAGSNNEKYAMADCIHNVYGQMKSGRDFESIRADIVQRAARFGYEDRAQSWFG